jgi:hypothetical protein
MPCICQFGLNPLMSSRHRDGSRALGLTYGAVAERVTDCRRISRATQSSRELRIVPGHLSRRCLDKHTRHLRCITVSTHGLVSLPLRWARHWLEGIKDVLDRHGVPSSSRRRAALTSRFAAVCTESLLLT